MDAHEHDAHTEVITYGGYRLLRHRRGVTMLNLDIGVLVDPGDARQWRRDVLELSDTFGYPVIPIGYTAASRAFRGRDVLLFSDVALIHRQHLEAVFRVDDKLYLSGYDQQESPPLYFLCELPGPVETVGEAREALKPESVRLAEAAGIPVKRQGDLFVIRSRLRKRHIKRMGGRLHHWPDPLPIYGTAHTATVTATLPDGRVLARGVMSHHPKLIGEPNRDPDHHPLVLGRKWWWVSRNTVPVTGFARSARR